MNFDSKKAIVGSAAVVMGWMSTGAVAQTTGCEPGVEEVSVHGAVGTSGMVRGVAYSMGRVYGLNIQGEVVVMNATMDCTPGCEADFNGDGVLNFFDVSSFIVLYSNGDAAADLNHDDRLSFFDVSRFLELYQAGCP